MTTGVRSRRLRSAAVALVVLAGCGSEAASPDATAGGGPAGAPGTAGAVSDDAGDRAEHGGGAATATSAGDLFGQQLAILGGSRPEVVAAVEAYGGVVTAEVEATATYQVAFPVTSLDELMDVRRQLEDEGFVVALVATIESP